jgi:hypothetical protein
MSRPIEINSAYQQASIAVDADFDIDVMMEAQSAQDFELYKLLAERRAQLEDSETLRRARAL